MIAFRTEVALPKIGNLISYRKNALMIGSCFTENIGRYLQDHCFPVMTNPCGILYNPASMADCLNFLVSERQFTAADLFYANGLWNNFYFHSRFSDPEKETALRNMNNSVKLASGQLRSASHLFLTFGTSWIYREKESGQVTGNCHKLPASTFIRERLSVEEMSGLWINLIHQLFESHPTLSIVLTVSPIRHFKDGSFENQVSKSGLFLLVEKLISIFGSDKIHYFPSYELVMDELRDYRFYATDMVHLSETAVSFVQEKFNEVFLDSESKEINSKIDKIIKSLSHKPFQKNGQLFQDFLSRQMDDLLKLETRCPFLHLEHLKTDIIQKRGH
ncbi:MAG TPA: GSCFA domain-containing protein [Prolixibacteraceae bacterium]